MSEAELELPTDLETFHGDTLLMHAKLLELELYRIRREMFADPGARKLTIGAGQPTEQSIRGNQQDPYNGVVILNPTPATISIGFQVGAGYLAPAVVPPFSWVAFPERYVNLSFALLNPADQQLTITDPVTVLRTRIPPDPGAGPYGVQEAWSELELTIAQPGAGSELSVSVPAGQWWKLESLTFSLTTSATVGNRFGQILFVDASGSIRARAAQPAAQNLPASSGPLVLEFTRLGPQVIGQQGVNGPPTQVPLPDLWVPPGYTIQTFGPALAGDQYTIARGLYRMATRQPK